MGERQRSDDGVAYRTLLSDPSLLSVFLVSGVSAFGINAVPVALPNIGRTFALTEAEIGLVVSAFQLGVFVALPAISILADMYGRRPVVIPSLVVLGISGVGTLWATTFPVLLGLRFVQGLAFASTVPFATTLIGDLYTGAEGASAQGIRGGVNGIGGALAPILSGALVVFAWQYPFVLFALALPVSVLFYRYYPEPVRDEPASAGYGFTAEFRAYWRGIRVAVDGRLGLLIAGGFALFFLKAGVKTFLPVFAVSQLGSPTTVVGVILGVYGGTRAVAAPVSGSIVARFGRRATMVLTALLAGATAALIPLATDVWSLGAIVVAYSGAEAVLNPVLNDAVASHAVDEYRGGLVGGLVVSKQVAKLIAPILIGAVIGGAGFLVAFSLTGLVAGGYAVAIARYFPARG